MLDELKVYLGTTPWALPVLAIAAFGLVLFARRTIGFRDAAAAVRARADRDGDSLRQLAVDLIREGREERTQHLMSLVLTRETSSTVGCHTPLMTDHRLVVGAIIVDSLESPTRILAARRSQPEELKGLWEFPGGKVEPGESPEEALVREIAEELSVRIYVGDELQHESGSWPISEQLHLRLFFAAVADGELALGDSHDELRLLAFDDLDEVPWLPSDQLAVDVLASRGR